MSEHRATVRWRRGPREGFSDGRYSRGHEWSFDGGVTIPASSSPLVVPLPCSVAAAVDPEEAFVASLSSCHMLFFLSLAAKKRLIVDEYVDDAVGVMAEDRNGRMTVTEVRLRPQVRFSGGREPAREQIEDLHHQAHELCFLANSVRSRIVVEVGADP